MKKFKIVFKDGDNEKCIFGWPDFDKEDTLLKVQTDRGNTVFINKEQIVFCKEIKGGI
jgi:hypothetical protein